MDRLAELIEQLSLTDLERMSRRTSLSVIGVGAIALVISIFLRHALVGVGVCLGLGAGVVNIRLITKSIARVQAGRDSRPTRVLASRTLSRLTVTTVIILGLMVASIDLGLGTAAGIAMFYLVLLLHLMRSLFHSSGAGVMR